MLYPKALPLALPEVHLCVADVFAEIASELWRIEEVCGIAEMRGIINDFAVAEEKLPNAIGNGN